MPKKLTKDDWGVIMAALHYAAEWEQSLMDGMKHMKDDQAYKGAERWKQQYLDLRARFIGECRGK